MGRARTAPAAADGDLVEIRFNGEPGHTLEIDSKTTVEGGKTVKVDQATATKLLAAPWANITLADKSAKAWPDSDAELDELAAKLGVELPAVTHEGGTPQLTLADKIAALEAAGYTPESAAAEAAKAETGSSNTSEEE